MRREWLAFAGKALLTTDAGELRALLEELRPGAGPENLKLIEEFEQALGEDLEKEYVRLFLSPTGAPCSLYQSAYGDDPALMGETHRSALEWFRKYGVEPKDGNEPADHAGKLLLFAAGVRPEDEAAFGKEHLGWLTELAEEIRREARGAWYPLLGRRLKAWARG